MTTVRIGFCSLLALGLFISAHAQDSQTPTANPARPTVTNPATLPPTGYLQFEQGYLGALDAPSTESQHSVVQTTKLTVASRAMLQLQTQPFAHSTVYGNATQDAGDVLLGGAFVVFTPAVSEDEAIKEAKDHHLHSYVAAAVPTVTFSYLGRVKSGSAPDVDFGSFSQGVAVLASGHAPFIDVHYDSNFLVNEQVDDSGIRHAQFGQTLSIDRAVLKPNFQISAELYHFTQPFVHATGGGKPIARANLVAALLALSWQTRPNLIFDGGFSRGLTSTTTRWQAFAGFTYLLPHRLWPARSLHN